MMSSAALRRRRASYVTLGVSLLVLGLKFLAYLLTGSVAFLSDAAESLVNVAGAVAVIVAVRLALQPPDYEHPYGHHKAEYLSSAFEGSLILLAAGMILVTAGQRLFHPEPLTNVSVGVGLALAATVLNGGVGLYLRREARTLHSAALEANMRHLFTDVWTSLGVVGTVGVVFLTGLYVLDPLIAMLVALNITREGWQVLTSSFSQLMDERLPDDEERVILDVLDAHPEVRGYHRLRSRRAGSGRFAEVDIFVEPSLTVADAHDLVVALEDELCRTLPELTTTIHVEPYVVGRRDGSRVPNQEYRR
jgi:cation diffusion facilitator family transporter